MDSESAAPHRLGRPPGARPTNRVIIGPHRWIIGALLSQVFLISAYVAILQSGKSVPVVIACLVLLLAFSASYVLLAGRQLRAPTSRRVGMVGLLFVLTLPQIAVLGVDASSLWIYVGVAGGLLFAARPALALGVALGAGMLLLDAVAGQPLSWELALTLVALTAFMVGFAGNIKLNIRLRETQEQLAVAAVAAERERIGRDLHDILGHSLTAIAVKAGLARRLLDRDPRAAVAEIADVERLAREALADVRATASGYRDVSLAAELAVAGSVLRAAGICAKLPVAVDNVDPGAREAFGFVVREAVTNVIRHSDASMCTVTIGASWVEVVDNGSGRARMAAGGAGGGLRGLTERLAALGGTVTAGPRVGGGFAVHAEMPTSATRDAVASTRLTVPADPAGGTRQ